jgi:hypothetical protein
MLSSELFPGVCSLTLSLLMSHICGVLSKTFGEWYTPYLLAYEHGTNTAFRNVDI